MRIGTWNLAGRWSPEHLDFVLALDCDDLLLLLFVREQALNEFGTSPYIFLGPARHVSHTGERPIAITWELDHAMPTEFFNAASVAAG